MRNVRRHNNSSRELFFNQEINEHLALVSVVVWPPLAQQQTKVVCHSEAFILQFDY